MTYGQRSILKTLPLFVKIPYDRVAAFRGIVKKANERYPISCNEKDDTDGVIFELTCLTNYFADAYYHIGVLSGQLWHSILKF